MKYTTLKKDDSIILNNQITKYITPKYVYLPIQEQPLKKVNIKKEEIIFDQIISPISGKIVQIDNCTIENGEEKKCLVIENDYKETLEKKNVVRKEITNLTKEQLINELKQFQKKELSEKMQQKDKILIVNTIEDEPYVANEIFISKKYTNIILEMIDALRVIMSYDNVRIVIQNNDRQTIESFNNFLGTYPHIELSLVPDYYLLEQERFLKEFLHTNEGIVIKPSEICLLYNIIKRKRKATTHFFTISGDGVKNPQVIEAKIGSKIIDIMKERIEENEGEKEIYINGLMKGFNFNITNLIVTEKLKSIHVMMQKEQKPKKCINCGKCYFLCPVSCNPRAYLKNKRKEDIEDCIACGLCSYICPSFIHLRKVIKGEDK